MNLYKQYVYYLKQLETKKFSLLALYIKLNMSFNATRASFGDVKIIA